MAESQLVVIVDDEADLAGAIAEYLERCGYRARTAGNGAEFFAAFERQQPDLVILDLNMPGENGRNILRRLRPSFQGPVIILTSTDDAADRIVLIESGADDYVVKPVELRELAARVSRHLERRQVRTSTMLRFETVTADLMGGRLLFDDGREERLTTPEIALLRLFNDAHGRVLSREDILMGLQEETESFDRAIDSRIARLRKKLATQMFITVRGAGYRLTLPG